MATREQQLQQIGASLQQAQQTASEVQAGIDRLRAQQQQTTEPVNFQEPTQMEDMTGTIPDIPQSTVQTTPTVAPMNFAEDALMQGQERKSAIAQQNLGTQTEMSFELANLMEEFRGKTGFEAKQLEDVVAPEEKILQQYNNRARMLAAEINMDDTRLAAGLAEIEDQAIPMEFITGQQVSLERRAQIARAFKVSELNMVNAAVLAQQGNVDLAKDAVDRAVNAKYGPIEEEVNIRKAQLEVLTPFFDNQEKKLAAAQQNIYNLQLQKIEDAKTEQKNIKNLGVTISKNGAPPFAVEELLQAKTEDEAILIASPYMRSLEQKADYAYKMAQIAKITREMEQAKVGFDPALSLAFAQQYAATGNIPTGMEKGQFGQVAAFAKELPKQNGQIVSTATGVTPAGASAQIGALGEVYSITQLAQQLKELDKERWGGLVAGTAGKIFGSDDQQRYIDMRTQIVDLLARARSGAALTAEEEKRYADMLPGRFDEPLGLGVDSQTRIDNFINVVTEDLINKTSAKGWSIYGMTEVKSGGETRTVGDIFTNAEGVTGRVNADGSVTIIQQ